MRIPTYQEMALEHSETTRKEVEAYVAQILTHMRRSGPQKRYTISNLRVRADLERLVKEKFAESHWKVEFCSDQRDGEWISVTSD